MSISVETGAAEKQLFWLKQQITEICQVRRELQNYKQQLNLAWVAQEMVYLNRSIDELTSSCRRLESMMGWLSEDIQSAIEEVELEKLL